MALANRRFVCGPGLEATILCACAWMKPSNSNDEIKSVFRLALAQIQAVILSKPQPPKELPYSGHQSTPSPQFLLVKILT